MRKELRITKVDIVIDKLLAVKHVIISCNEFSKEISRIKEYAEQIENTITVKIGNDKMQIIPTEIFYIESVDKHTFIYLESGVGESSLRLYELEEMLNKSKFLRVSKSCIVNMVNVKSISVMINRNLTLTMSNGEKVIVSRRYVKKMNELIGME